MRALMERCLINAKRHGIFMFDIAGVLVVPIPKLNSGDSFLEIPKTHILAL